MKNLGILLIALGLLIIFGFLGYLLFLQLGLCALVFLMGIIMSIIGLIIVARKD